MKMVGFLAKTMAGLVCSRCCQTGLWHARSRLVLIHFECELDAIIHVRQEATSDAKESLRERVLVMACKALDDSAAVWKSAGERKRKSGSGGDGSERTVSAL